MTRQLSDRTVERLREVSRAPELAAGGYRLIERIGRGGMGVVYRAEDAKLGREVALKVLEPSDASAELASRLVREAQVLARLEHPGIVPVHDVGVLDDGRLYYTMKLVRGERLDGYLRGGRSLAERLRVFVRICEAVGFAHDRGVLHRDLKPANVMVGAFGEVLVMDWGVAKILGSGRAAGAGRSVSAPQAPATGLTAAGTIMGTPGFMAPEQARGEIDDLDERADVFSLGAVLRTMLAGDEAPSEATTKTLPAAAGVAPAPSPGGLPKRLAAIVAKAMAPEREARYARVEELVADVESFLDGRAVSALPESAWTRIAHFVARHRVAVVLILVYVIVRTLVLLYGGR